MLVVFILGKGRGVVFFKGGFVRRVLFGLGVIEVYYFGVNYSRNLVWKRVY